MLYLSALHQHVVEALRRNAAAADHLTDTRPAARTLRRARIRAHSPSNGLLPPGGAGPEPKKGQPA
jgi:hypothetical protein